MDFHVHLDNSTIDKALELSRERRIKFGIVEHAGTKENQYPTLLSNDADLRRYLAMLDGKPVFKGVQAEWTDWMSCFSPAALAQLDYVLTDAMTFPGKNGARVKLWSSDASPTGGHDRQTGLHGPLRGLACRSNGAGALRYPRQHLLAACRHDRKWELYWTPPRMEKVIQAALKYGIALEISSSYQLPKLPFLKLAKAAGAKFSFGSNGRYPNMGKLDYCFAMAKELDLKPADMFAPAPDGQKAVQRRKF